MSTVVRKVTFFLCLRCGHEWQSRAAQKRPRMCPECKRENWDTTPNPSKATEREKVRA